MKEILKRLSDLAGSELEARAPLSSAHGTFPTPYLPACNMLLKILSCGSSVSCYLVPPCVRRQNSADPCVP